jgi:ubiquitin carboxyl-terminal hydrolase 34
MNIDFRDFVFNVDVNEPQGSQTLIHQLQYLFSRLLLGIEKAAHPQELAHSIIDFEGTPINIHIQMDVDEFFNLLFDRIEGQLNGPEERRRFRKLYGGVLCHTIKSRECSHVSARDEDFAAIQCDVRGKNTLEESLASYVKGEVMDGGMYPCRTKANDRQQVQLRGLWSSRRRGKANLDKIFAR